MKEENFKQLIAEMEKSKKNNMLGFKLTFDGNDLPNEQQIKEVSKYMGTIIDIDLININASTPNAQQFVDNLAEAIKVSSDPQKTGKKVRLQQVDLSTYDIEPLTDAFISYSKVASFDWTGSILGDRNRRIVDELEDISWGAAWTNYKGTGMMYALDDGVKELNESFDKFAKKLSGLGLEEKTLEQLKYRETYKEISERQKNSQTMEMENVPVKSVVVGLATYPASWFKKAMGDPEKGQLVHDMVKREALYKYSGAGKSLTTRDGARPGLPKDVVKNEILPRLGTETTRKALKHYRKNNPNNNRNR